MPKLHYVLRGIKSKEAERLSGSGGSRERLPITPPLLLRMKAVWEREPNRANAKMLWAASCLCFFAFLRVGEMTVPKDGGFDPAVHLGVGDVAVDDPRKPSLVRIRIKRSKTDPFRKGIDLFVGKTGSELCPVAAMLDYLLSRRTGPGPLFLFQDGRPLTRPRFAEAIRSALNRAGMDQAKFCTHSFRIGAATTAAAKGIADSVIKTLGRWESTAYLQYVRLPRQRLAEFSRRLGGS